MSWRSIQLNKQLCDQDQIILDLFSCVPVKYVGNDKEFAKKLTVDSTATNLILVINDNIWLSDLARQIQTNLIGISNFYISINRYRILGNDTDYNASPLESPGPAIINFVKQLVTTLGYTVEQSGSFDQDRGRYFNFVQPLTWLYGKTSNTSN